MNNDQPRYRGLVKTEHSVIIMDAHQNYLSRKMFYICLETNKQFHYIKSIIT